MGKEQRQRLSAPILRGEEQRFTWRELATMGAVSKRTPAGYDVQLDVGIEQKKPEEVKEISSS